MSEDPTTVESTTSSDPADNGTDLGADLFEADNLTEAQNDGAGGQVTDTTQANQQPPSNESYQPNDPDLLRADYNRKMHDLGEQRRQLQSDREAFLQQQQAWIQQQQAPQTPATPDDPTAGMQFESPQARQEYLAAIGTVDQRVDGRLTPMQEEMKRIRDELNQYKEGYGQLNQYVQQQQQTQMQGEIQQAITDHTEEVVRQFAPPGS